MGIRFACHACQKPLNIKSELAGKRGVCPQCGTRFRIPSDNASHSSPIADAALSISPSTGLAAVLDASPRTALRQAAPISNPGISKSSSLLDDPTAVWYVRPPSGGQYGPATGDVLRGWIAEARVTANSLIWRDGWSQWRSANEALSEFGAKTTPDVAMLKSSARPSTASVAPLASPVSPTLQGDATIGMQKSKRTNQRFIIVGTLAAICMTLLGVLIILMQK